MRAILNRSAAETIGREDAAIAEADGQQAGTTDLNGERVPVPRYSAILPTRAFEGDIEQTCLTAGQSAGNINAVRPAGEIVRMMTDEAVASLLRFAPARQVA